MPDLLFAAIADDDTGATDLAGMLADQSVRTVLFIDLPDDESFATHSRDAEAVIIGIASRAIAPEDARRRTREAARLLASKNPRTIEFKYCSTFDSTAEGNIGPSIEACLDELDLDFTVALPALPVLGRTTYMGYHFVHQQLLSDSPLRNHPLNPMTNPNLVSHLQAQTARKVALVPHPLVRRGSDALLTHFAEIRSAGVNIALLDCVGDDDLRSICEAIAPLPLITGSSAPATHLPRIWRREGLWRDSGRELLPPLPTSPRGVLIVAGSCSTATRGQNDWYERHIGPSIVLDPAAILAGTAKVSAAIEAIREGRHALVRTDSSTESVEAFQAWAAAERNLTPIGAGLELSSALARLCLQIVDAAHPRGLIVAGGETSGAICRALDLRALRIGRNIEPGVPLCLSLGRLAIPLVLKSGNFGSPDFYSRALRAM